MDALISNPSSQPQADDVVNNTESNPLRILDLPAELRNDIYKREANYHYTTILLDEDVSKTKLTSTSPLLRANKKISKEFRSMLIESENIDVIVKNFDVKPLIEYLASLSKNESEAIKRATFAITLRFGEANWAEFEFSPAATPTLHSWLQSLSQLEAKRAEIEGVYHNYSGRLSFEEFMGGLGEREHWMERKGVDGASEMQKMMDAINAAVPM